MDLVKFGEFVKQLRETYHRKHWPWRQEDLAKRANISAQTIARIERGDVKKMYEHLEPLAKAFGLNELQKADLYAQAGYHYRPKLISDNREVVNKILSNIVLPASAKTPLWDLVAFNEYHRLLWHYPAENVEALNEGKLGPNLLRVYFEERFSTRQSKQIESVDRLLEVVYIFRTAAFPYIGTKRYQTIVDEMMQNHKTFREAWDETDKLQIPSQRNRQSSNLTFTNPIATLANPTYGSIAKIGTVLPQRFTGHGIDISVHLPILTPETVDGYHKFQEIIKSTPNKVYMFREEKLE